MNKQFKFLFSYLEKENIFIDKNEFLFQVQSHPDYPSLLSIVDTLSFFNIQNIMFRIDVSKLESLPNRFITLLKEENAEPKLYFVEKINKENYKLKGNNTIEIDNTTLISKWTGLILLTESTEKVETTLLKNKSGIIFLFISIILLGGILFNSENAIYTTFFLIFPIIGFIFSIAALKDLIGVKSELINSFCNISTSTNCSSIVGSKKWKFFEVIDFSSLSIIFFSSQLVGLFLFTINKKANEYLEIQSLLILFSIPLILLSLYYQKFIEKKWCPICLVIVSNLILELLFITSFQINYSTISYSSIIQSAFIFSTITYCWIILKPILAKQKEIRQIALKGNKFIRDYDIFKSILTATNKIEVPEFPMILGNKNSSTQITLITNPFCGHCEGVHANLEKILNQHKEKIQVKIIFAPNLDFTDDNNKKVFRKLMSEYFEKGEVSFRNLLDNWFKTDNKNEWLRINTSETNRDNFYDEILKTQNSWTSLNNYNFTPAIFINGYEYPKKYDRKELEFFVNELIEDNDFN